MSERVRLSFQRWDTEGRGVICKNELAYVLRWLDPDTTDGELEALFSAAQINHEDTISYERFVSWLFCDVPDVFGKLGITEFNAAVKSKCLWDVALTAAVADAVKKLPRAKVDAYFSDVRRLVTGPEFTEQVRAQFFQRFGTTHGSATFEDVANLVESTLHCEAAMRTTRPTRNEIRATFDTHDAQAGGRGRLGADEVVNLVRHLQVRVALATLLEAEARAGRDVKELQVNLERRAEGLWEEAMAIAKAKASQRFNKQKVDAYFEEVNARLTGEEYAEHVKGELFRKVDADKDGKVSFAEALGLIHRTLQCAADLGGENGPTPEAIREVFNAHDTIAFGWNFMGGDEFLNLMRYLQVHVADVMLPMSKVVQEK